MKQGVLLDLFCGAGGGAVGYHRGGFQVIGVDIKHQKNYPFKFIQANVFDFLRSVNLDRFKAIHASPPCQRFSASTPDKSIHSDLLTPTRQALIETGIPWIIENVPGAPMRRDVVICGCMVGLPLLKRKRLFETSWNAFTLLPPCQHAGLTMTVVGHSTSKRNRKAWGRHLRVSDLKRAMGIDWMTRRELVQSIPPNYTELMGSLLIKHLASKRPRKPGS